MSIFFVPFNDAEHGSDTPPWSWDTKKMSLETILECAIASVGATAENAVFFAKELNDASAFATAIKKGRFYETLHNAYMMGYKEGALNLKRKSEAEVAEDMRFLARREDKESDYFSETKLLLEKLLLID